MLLSTTLTLISRIVERLEIDAKQTYLVDTYLVLMTMAAMLATYCVVEWLLRR